MKRTKIKAELSDFPKEFHPLITNADIYDSSCSPEARVVFIDKDTGYFLKRAPKDTLRREYVVSDYFSSLLLTKKPLAYLSLENDWLLTPRVNGEDATHSTYLSDGKRLAETLGEILRALHELSATDCPINHRLTAYLDLAKKNYREGNFDTGFFICDKPRTKDEIYRRALEGFPYLESNCLIHGDFCLPNVIFNDWKLSGYIDLGNGGIADRHIDLYWGAWTLNFNLKTDKYRERFFDAYGRDKIDPEKLVTISAFEVFG